MQTKKSERQKSESRKESYNYDVVLSDFRTFPTYGLLTSTSRGPLYFDLFLLQFQTSRISLIYYQIAGYLY